MRDFERLEELSSTVQSGLKSNEVIWAIDKALSGEALEEGERESLARGSEILEGVGEPEGSGETPEARRSQSMLGGEAVATLRIAVLSAANRDEDDEQANAIATELAQALKAVSRGEAAATHRDALESALEVFSMISEVKLGQASGIVRTRRESALWPSRTTISSSS
jgi:hypothetical protein